ncbi:hypothetical protein [Antarcticirhabdus aurantiaca]|uniref:Uncharacterized protein n=1 Tax=Antarcticirhabdus aurantiaca TaxID=2606717 RepID=A0ACD4NRC8_9HYPH|nr:hypothetical protein OXU80_03510 [Jeongeuplla avenae]
MTKKSTTIEALLQWAYRQELPKTGRAGTAGPGTGSAWGMVASFGELHALIDATNAYGCVPDWHATEEPHPDALRVHAAMPLLDDVSFVVPEGFDVLPEVGELRLEERADCHARGLAIARIGAGRLRTIVTGAAMLGKAPSWQAAIVERRPVHGPNGAPLWMRKVTRADGLELWIDGFNPRSRRPFAGAMRRTRLDPDPVAFVVERVEYQAFALALDALADELAGTLSSWSIDPRPLHPAPWVPGSKRGQVVTLEMTFSTASHQRPRKAS